MMDRRARHKASPQRMARHLASVQPNTGRIMLDQTGNIRGMQGLPASRPPTPHGLKERPLCDPGCVQPRVEAG